MKVFLPFKLNYIPMKKLTLINFEKDPEDIYRGLELQYIDGEEYGTGWRILAYRNDKYVDVYDEKGILKGENESFDVAEKGLANYKKVAMDNVYFYKDKLGVHMGFKFVDILGRDIEVKIDENSNKKTKGVNLLAPIGSGTEKPVLLPLFFLYDFDFVRKSKTQIYININGKSIKPDNFPIPIIKNFQRIYFIRYSMDSQIVEFAKASEEKLEVVELQNGGVVKRLGNSYKFRADNIEKGLEEILYEHEEHPIKISFKPCIPVVFENSKDVTGEFIIQTDERAGTISGSYEYRLKDKKIFITLTSSKGWEAVPDSFFTKMMFSKKSIFTTWSKQYKYTQEILLDDFTSKAVWQKTNNI